MTRSAKGTLREEVIQLGSSDDVHIQLVVKSPLKGTNVPRLHLRVYDTAAKKETFVFGFRDGFEKIETAAALSRVLNEYFLARLEELKSKAGW